MEILLVTFHHEQLKIKSPHAYGGWKILVCDCCPVMIYKHCMPVYCITHRHIVILVEYEHSQKRRPPEYSDCMLASQAVFVCGAVFKIVDISFKFHLLFPLSYLVLLLYHTPGLLSSAFFDFVQNFKNSIFAICVSIPFYAVICFIVKQDSTFIFRYGAFRCAI